MIVLSPCKKETINNIIATNINQNKDVNKIPKNEILANVEIESFPVADSTTTCDIRTDVENGKSNTMIISTNNGIKILF